MSSIFYLPTTNFMGAGALLDSVDTIKSYGFTKALIVTDRPLVDLGIAPHVANLLERAGVDSVIFDAVKPNPTIENVNMGLEVLNNNHCDLVVAVGGGSPIDCAKAIALLATNFGEVEDFEGVDISEKPMMPLVAVNTTAGTGSELTRFAVITNEKTHIKMAIVDKHITPLISVNDPELTKGMPASLTAATGLDALTHAIEAIMSTASTPFTDACAEKSIPLVFEHLEAAVADGNNLVAREGMMYAQTLAGAAFNSALLGAVHALAHQCGGLVDMPHGQANAILLPHVFAYNAKACNSEVRLIAGLIGISVDGLTDTQVANEVVQSIKELSASVKIPAGLAEFGITEAQLPVLAENALKDACMATNPIPPTKEDLIQILRNAL